jgi:hypothetical protein
MAHFAELNETNTVLRVLVVPDEQEHRGQEFLADDLGLGGTWVQTSYRTQGNIHATGGTPLRFNYAGIGSIYNPDADVFYAPSPYPSWVLNTTTYLWEAPTPYPDDGKFYEWDEDTTSWVEVV